MLKNLDTVLNHDISQATKGYLVAFFAFWGSFNLNDWSLLLGLFIVCLRIPIEVHNLASFIKRQRKTQKRRYNDRINDDDKSN